jgi:hypothetical protein
MMHYPRSVYSTEDLPSENLEKLNRTEGSPSEIRQPIKFYVARPMLTHTK